MIEVDVHQQLHAFLRDQGEGHWPHHLTVARLVARALRLQRSALIQVSASASYQGHYRLSYLASLMMWPGPAILVAPETVQQSLLHSEIPRLREWMRLQKPICTGPHWPHPSFAGVLLLSPHAWLEQHSTTPSPLPPGIPTLVDGADHLETWAQSHLTLSLQPQDWDQLMWCYPQQADGIRDVRAQLTCDIFQHPDNPYNCILIDPPKQQLLHGLYQTLSTSDPTAIPSTWQWLWQRLSEDNQLTWVQINRQQGSFILHTAPIAVSTILKDLWSHQAVVLLGSAFDLEPRATLYRQKVGLGDLTQVQFAAERQTEAVHLYLPDGLPMPNTPEFQAVLLQQFNRLLMVSRDTSQSIVLIIEDSPLKSQVASVLAAEYGSRIRVETTPIRADSILITGWDYWLQAQQRVPSPQLLAIATLPIPSLEDPRVAGRVAYYKRRRQDWFRLYLLPEALRTLQQAIAPVRAYQGVVALLDNRVLHRSYGKQVLAALSPYARIDYVEANLLASTHDLV